MQQTGLTAAFSATAFFVTALSLLKERRENARERNKKTNDE